MNSSAREKRLLTILTAMLLSIGMIGLCSKSSPLYPLNDSPDVNCFFTLGREMLHGKVPYRDFYEQKGPVLYAVFAAASLISSTGFLGVYLLEIAAFTLLLYWSGRITALYTHRPVAPFLTMIALAVLIPPSAAFENGAGVEELLLGTLAYSLYQVLAAMHGKRPVRSAAAVWIGVCAAAAFWSKYTVCGFYAALALSVLIDHLVSRRPLRQLGVIIGCFLGGVALVSAAVLAYFAANGALNDLFGQYFYNNIFLYPSEGGRTLGGIFSLLRDTLLENSRTYGRLILLGLIAMLPLAFRRPREAAAVLLTFGGLAFTTYMTGKDYPYYGLILAGYAVFGCTAILFAAEWLLRRVKGRASLAILLCAAAVGCGGWYAYGQSRNIPMLGQSLSDTPQGRFAAVIHQVDQATLLNFGFLDSGFYLAAQTSPACRAFCLLNVPLPEIYQTQKDCVAQEQVDFLVLRNFLLEDADIQTDAYVLLDEQTQRSEDLFSVYYLYGKRDLCVTVQSHETEDISTDDYEEDDWDF